MERKIWIDTLKGISMLAILLFHTEIYYAGSDVVSYCFYVENALTAFAFVSGYLFIKPEGGFSMSKKAMAIVRGLILPYFIFTIILALGKWLVGSSGASIGELLLNILTGTTSWYVAALIVAELIFGGLLVLSRSNLLITYIVSSLLLVGLTMLSAGCFGVVNMAAVDVWRWQEAVILLFFMCLGAIYRKSEHRFQFFNTTYSLLLLIILMGIMKYYEHALEWKMMVAPVEITSWWVFVADCLLTILLLINVCKRLPSLSILTFIGRNSIVVYFLCGAVPYIMSLLFSRIGLPFNGDYLRILLVYIFVIDATTISTYIIRCFVWRQ